MGHRQNAKRSIVTGGMPAHRRRVTVCLRGGRATDGRDRDLVAVLSKTSGTPVAAFGGAGSGSYAAFVLRRIEAAGGAQRFAGLLNDTVAAGASIGGDTVLGPFDAWSSLPPDTMFLAPLQKPKLTHARVMRFAGLRIPDARWASVVDPAAIVAPDCSVGHGAFVAPHAVLMPACRIGRHVAVRQGVTVAHNVTVGDWCMFAANSAIGGYASIGDGSFVGLGAVVRDNVAVGRFAVIGMGAVVTRDVPDFTIVAGNPARIIGDVDTTVGEQS